PHQGLPLMEMEGIVHHWMRRHSGWLLIVQEVNDADSAEVVRALMQANKHGQFLIAGRAAHEDFGVTHWLRELTVDESVRLLEQELGSDMRALGLQPPHLRQLCEEVGGLTTVLEAAVGALRQRRLPWFQVEAELEKSRAWFRGLRQGEHWQVEFSETAGGLLRLNLSGLSPSALTLLNLSAFGASTPVPLWLFTENQQVLRDLQSWMTHAPFAEADFPVQAAASELRDVRVARLHHEQLEFNRLVVDFGRASIDYAAEREPDANGTLRWTRGMLDLVTQAAERAQALPERWTVLRPHAESVLERVEAAGLKVPALGLLQLLAQFYRDAGLNERAVVLLERAVKIRRTATREADQPEATALSALLTQLGFLYLDAGQPASARRLLQEVSDAAEPDSSARAEALHDLAHAAMYENDLGHALELRREALLIEQEQRGREHPAVARRMFHLGDTLLAAGRVDEAQSVLEHAYHQLHRPGEALSAEAAGCALALARTHLAEGRQPEAEELLIGVIQRVHGEYGRLSPRCIEPQSLLAEVRVQEGRWEAAETTLIELLAVLQQVKGEGHPEVSQALRRLAEVNFEQERWRTCRGQLERALRIDQTLFGALGPELYPTLDFLAELFWYNEKHEEAQRYLSWAWSIAHEHPESVDLLPARLHARLMEVFPNHPPGSEAPLPRAEQLESAQPDNTEASPDISGGSTSVGTHAPADQTAS
ncbi:MAG: tetratricopeptide repeat protein, partial [Opitutales bacterium]